MAPIRGGETIIMQRNLALLAPLALMFVAPSAAEAPLAGPIASVAAGDVPAEALAPEHSALHPAPLQQVRLEQHISIRISPGVPQMPPQILIELQQDELPPQFTERKWGKCLALNGIGAVQSGEGNRLLLFMRDQHIVSALLEKACQARDFYMGFYVERNADGMICVDRDRLQSRSGANCKLKRLRAVVER